MPTTEDDVHYHYPIERIASATRTRFQRGFALMAMYLMPAMQDVMYEPTELGLRLLGSEESALDTPADILREIYGDEVRVGRPRARLVRDAEGVKEPVMNLRIAAPAAAQRAILDDLSGREAVLQEIESQGEVAVLRARARLRSILGYRPVLAAMTSGRADLRVWLSHYEPVPPPGGHAA